MGRVILLLILGCSSLWGKVYDCFMFFNEMEILSVRFAELYDHVDAFVIVEARETHSGHKKSLQLRRMLGQKFRKYRDKIILLEAPVIETTDKWERETKQRDWIMQGLKYASPSDVVIISDCDEIVKARRLQELVEYVKEHPDDVVAIDCAMYRYYLNRKESERWNKLPYMCTFGKLQQKTPTYYRRTFKNKVIPFTDTGWHFTNQGGIERLQQKWMSFAHSADKPIQRNLMRLVRNKEQEMRRLAEGLEFVEIDESFPKSIVSRYDMFVNKGFIDCEK